MNINGLIYQFKNEEALRFQQKIGKREEKAYDVKVEKVGTKKVSLNIRWLDIKNKFQSDNVTIREGDHIEF